MTEEMQDAISWESEGSSGVGTDLCFDTNSKDDSSGKAWCFRIQNQVAVAALKG